MSSKAAMGALPEEVITPSTPRRIVAAVCGVMALVALLDLGAIAVLHHHPVNHGYQVIRAKWQLLDEQKGPVDWLVLGDSSGNQGVVPDVLTRRLGGSALNLCTVGGLTAVHDAWMLDQYIQRVGAPAQMIIVHAYDVWSREPNIDAFAQVPLPPRAYTRMAPPLELGIKEWKRILLDRYLPLYSQNESLSRLITAPRKTLGRRFNLDAHGYLKAGRPLPDEVLADAAIHVRSVKKNAFRLSPSNLEALRVIADLAERRGIEVYIANGPVFEGLYREPAFRAYISALHAALEDFARGRPRLHVVDLEPLTFRADEMTNADHLTHPAAMTYTSALADAIAVFRAGLVPTQTARKGQ